MNRLPLYKYPYTDYHDLNLDWVIERIQEMYSIVDEKIANAVNPIINNLNELTIRVDNIDTLIRGLTTRMNSAESSINNINTTLNTYANNFSDIDNALSTLNEHFIRVDTDIVNLKDITDEHTNEIIDIYNRIRNLDPVGSLIVDANGFNLETKTANILNSIYNFSLKGSTRDETFILYPDLIPGTQSGFYPRVTMLEDSTTHKIKLPSELVVGDAPTIIRGTYAINVNKDAEIYAGDPLEYSINGNRLTIEGSDENAIILICIVSLHRGVNGEDGIENMFVDNDITFIKGMPETRNNRYEGVISIPTLTPKMFGLNPYAYFFDIEGNLLSYNLLTNEGISIPTGTYSIWYGIYAPTIHEIWTNTDFKIILPTSSGIYRYTNSGFITEHIVNFTDYDNNTITITASKSGIANLESFDTIDMVTGDFYRGTYIMDNMKHDINNNLSSLIPEKDYIVTLPFKDTGYSEARLKYNKIMVLLDSLNGNNIEY